MGYYVSIWPKDYQLKQVKGSNGKIYKYDIYVDDEGLLKGLEYNEIATYFAHPFNIHRGHMIVGDAIIVPQDPKLKYTLEDFEAIKDGVWVNDDADNVDLVEYNLGMKKEDDKEKEVVDVDQDTLQISIEAPRSKSGYTVEELKLICMQLELSSKGKKFELAQRIANKLA
jgi:hypothetical protein